MVDSIFSGHGVGPLAISGLAITFPFMNLGAAFGAMVGVGASTLISVKLGQRDYGTAQTVLGNVITLNLIIGIALAVIVALILLGGIKRIGAVTEALIPFMSVMYIAFTLIVVIVHAGNIGDAFVKIFSTAFTPQAMFGASTGIVLKQTIIWGLRRSAFSNEAGLGSAAIAHAAADTKGPVNQGLYGIFEVFADTMIVCTMTALVVLTTNVHSGAFQSGAFYAIGNDSAAALGAFSQDLGMVGAIIFSVFLPLFAFTTILAWSYYGEKATEFFFDWTSKKGQKIAVVVFKVIYVVLIVAAAVIEGELLWAIDDTFNGLMALPNLVAVVLLSGQVAKITKNYYERKSGKNVEPMLSAYPELNEEFKKDIEKDVKLGD